MNKMEKVDINDIVSIKQDGALFYCAKSLDNGEWIPVLICQPAYHRTMEINGELYMDDRYITIISDRNTCSLLSKVKNPYIFKVNGRLVRMKFSENGTTAYECLTNMLENLYR